MQGDFSLLLQYVSHPLSGFYSHPQAKLSANGPTMLGAVGSCCTWLKSLTGFKLCVTTPNKQLPTTMAVCNIRKCLTLLSFGTL